MKVERWGDSLAVRLPDALIEALGLKEGDDIEIHVTLNERSNIERLRTFRGRLPKDFKFDRDEANSR